MCKIHFCEYIPNILNDVKPEMFDVNSFDELIERQSKWLEDGEVFVTDKTEGRYLMILSPQKDHCSLFGFVKGIDLRTKLSCAEDACKPKDKDGEDDGKYINSINQIICQMAWKNTQKLDRSYKKLQPFLGKKVKVILFDGSTMTGILTCPSCDIYCYEVENYIFSGTQVKRIKVIK